MSEPKTALDLAAELSGRIFRRPDCARPDVRNALRDGMTGPLLDRLAAIPADAVEQIEALRAEVAILRAKLDAERRTARC